MFDLSPRLRHSRQNRHTFFNARVDLTCPVCGGAVAFEPRAIGVICGSCRSPLHRQPDDDTPLSPTGVLPFRLSDDEARQKLAAQADQPDWLAGGPGQRPTLRPLYVPYWRFAAHVVARWSVHEHDRRYDTHDTSGGGVATDYDQVMLAAAVDGDPSACAALEPTRLAEAVAFEPSLLAGVDVLPPTVALADAWVATRERWEKRLWDLMHRDADVGAFGSRSMDDTSSEFSQERGALVYVPVYVPERDDAAAMALVVDGYSGDVVHAWRKASKPRAEVDAEVDAGVPQVPEAAIGAAVLAVIAIVVLLLGLWLAQRLWWY